MRIDNAGRMPALSGVIHTISLTALNEPGKRIFFGRLGWKADCEKADGVSGFHL
jgi:hypothetical protein